MQLTQQIADVPYWYHKITLPDGTITPGWAPIDPARYSIPEDLTGKRVLDIGAWDGYWTWEALNRGAKEVVAIDDFTDDCGTGTPRCGWDAFDLCREAFGFYKEVGPIPAMDDWVNQQNQTVRRIEMSIYDVTRKQLGTFDVVFFFGTIYHLKHPLLALEKISDVCTGSLYVETASLDEYSPYRGGIGHGFDRNEVVMEFYPGAEYGRNESNYWAPTLECLGAMMASVGFKEIDAWPLTETPKELSQCRGFASGTKDPMKEPVNRPDEVAAYVAPATMKVAAVMSVPRLGFMDNMTCAQEALWPLRIPLVNVQGAFWGQILERGMQMLVDNGADVLLTIDYDTAFKKADVEAILRLLHEHPEASAVVPLQRGRAGMPMLMSMKTRSGQPRKDVPLAELQQAETARIASGHFGLTAIRVKDLLDIPHPWYWDQPNQDGQWGPGRIDADIYFWKQCEKFQKTVLLATRVVVGHLELMIRWPDQNMEPVYQVPGTFHDQGKPDNVWK